MAATVASREGEVLYVLPKGPVLYVTWRQQASTNAEKVLSVHEPSATLSAIDEFGRNRHLIRVGDPTPGEFPERDIKIMRDFNPDGMIICPCRKQKE